MATEGSSCEMSMLDGCRQW